MASPQGNLTDALLEPERLLDHIGTTREQLIRARVQQGFFRKLVLSNFDETCCISGLKQPSLLVASHIVGWADAVEHRLSPHNGLSLSALYDRAFDQHLLTFNDSLEVLLSPRLQRQVASSPYDCGLLEVEGRAIIRPRRFAIDPALMALHRQQFLLKSVTP